MSSAGDNTAAPSTASASAPPQQQPQPAQAAAPAQASASATAPSPSRSAPTGDSLTCQWASCGERCTTASELYDHVCERHVGRKSTNNLNLTCQWGNCRTTTVKRDHITSHIRVHVPLKPHKCDFCNKAFKRPQDLKKHVKTHADDSVLLRSPEPNRAQHGGGAAGYQTGAGKRASVADLQALAATASGYYPDGGLGANPGYHQNGGNPSAFYPNAPQGSSYGPVYYAVNQPGNLNNDSYETRKRAAMDALNEFFGDAKRRLIDPTTYYDVGQRLMALQGVPLLGGYHGGGIPAEYGGGPALMTASHPGPPHHPYALPLPNVRTKSDLVNIDQFLETLQATVYENSNQAAAAGVQQPMSHYVHPTLSYRSSNSPPGAQPQAATSHAAQTSSHATAAATSAPMQVATTSATSDTPALTPASSVMSYTSGQSPNAGGQQNISPVTRPSMGPMYPTLPAVSAMSDMSGSYTTSSSAPISSLATSFDPDSRRRYSGGLLQKAQPGSPADEDKMDLSSDRGTPRNSPTPTVTPADSKPVDAFGALPSPMEQRSPAESGADSPSLADREQERWLQNMRVIESLRSFIKTRLQEHEYDSDSDSGLGHRPGAMSSSPPIDPDMVAGTEASSHAHDMKEDEERLYPVLKAAIGDD
ncbi:hypothetical protein BDY21DRAFT_323515 [Lineolata rhizophorae]|uniref:C2H2-type domain-containing protein n=1 Tax=Lineolata rhizophorae TaxID=578093 RepID=A0A6A6NVI7_9PEZI|nr:hypothetical protein BDY21DRAFT_323515 [Lineolata rhizophorae]